MKQILSLVLAALAFTVQAYEVPKAQTAINIDGKIDESWQQAQWWAMDQHMLGEMPSKEDFSGRFKLMWDEGYLYILAEIQDDVLYDAHPDPKVAYWDDDCLEIFIDENASGGDHLYNFNAFAYHLSLDHQAADMGAKQADGSHQVLLLNDHVRSQWRRSEEKPHNIIWEVALKIYDDSFDPAGSNQPLLLSDGKVMGFMLAYCDNDGSKEREHFLGSTAIAPVNGDKNLGYKNASVFSQVILVK